VNTAPRTGRVNTGERFQLVLDHAQFRRAAHPSPHRRSVSDETLTAKEGARTPRIPQWRYCSGPGKCSFRRNRRRFQRKYFDAIQRPPPSESLHSGTRHASSITTTRGKLFHSVVFRIHVRLSQSARIHRVALTVDFSTALPHQQTKRPSSVRITR